MDVVRRLEEVSETYRALKALSNAPGAVMVNAKDLGFLCWAYECSLEALKDVSDELEITEAAFGVAEEGYRRALQDTGLAEQRLRDLGTRRAAVAKTGAERYFDEQMRDPEYAAEYRKARAEIDAVDDAAAGKTK